MINVLALDDFLKMALNEDIGWGDVTTDSLIDVSQKSKGGLYAKETGIIAGIKVAGRVFSLLDKNVVFTACKSDGSAVKAGDKIAEVEGNTRAILKGERVALNILQRMSGIATKTHHLCELVKGYPAKVADTRKTLPGFRMLDKYSVAVGGGINHRMCLSDLVLIKDNHIAAVGSVSKAVELARGKAPFSVKIEVEVENMKELEEAVGAKADIIMLDNMCCSAMKQAVQFVNHRAMLEASGNIDEKNIAEVAATGVDIISCGSLTHSVKALDISLKFNK